jgi:transcriptional regulator with XRE-family HTH domain
MDIVSARLRAARTAKRLSQKELSEALDMDQTHISRAEKGERGLTQEQLRRAARLLDVSADYLLGIDLNDRAAGYRTDEASSEQKRLIQNHAAPPGLRDLALNLELVNTLKVTEDEWHALTSISLPGEVSRDGYVQLLFTIRAICHT